MVAEGEEESDDEDFKIKLEVLQEELEVLNSEAHELGEILLLLMLRRNFRTIMRTIKKIGEIATLIRFTS